MTTDVVELQRRQIKKLEDYIQKQTNDMCNLIETNRNLSNAICYLTNKEDSEMVLACLDKAITDYCENNPNA